MLQLDERGRLKLTERDVTKQCIDLLRLEGWYCIRLESELVTGPSGKPKRLGETGQPDWLIIRSVSPLPWLEGFFLEFKAPGRKPRPSQRAWHERMQRDGYTVACVDSSAALVEFLVAHRWVRE